MNKLVIGTRKSQLAMVQTELAVEALKKGDIESEYVIEAIQTTGDKILDRPLLSFGGKGIFIEEFEQRLQNGDIDLAVHSAKDMPAVLGKGLEIAATLEREDPRDVLVWRRGEKIEEKENLIIGTGSKRREIQVKKLYACQCKLLRGNVNTRLSKLEQGEYDAIILAAAGLKRLGLLSNEKYEIRYFDVSEMVPSGGQGIIALETRANSKASQIAGGISVQDSCFRLLLERYVLEKMNAGCHEPIGVYSEIVEQTLKLYVMDGRDGRAKHYKKDITLGKETMNALARNGISTKWEEILPEIYGIVDEWLKECNCI